MYIFGSTFQLEKYKFAVNSSPTTKYNVYSISYNPVIKLLLLSIESMEIDSEIGLML